MVHHLPSPQQLRSSACVSQLLGTATSRHFWSGRVRTDGQNQAAKEGGLEKVVESYGKTIGKWWLNGGLMGFFMFLFSMGFTLW